MQPPTLAPGDIVSAMTRGALAAKRRPTVVISTPLYQATHGRDLIVALVTTQLHQATTPTDYVLQDWAAAGLHRPSAVRVYLETVETAQAQWIGRLTDRDWQEVQARLRLALAVT
jgi:mRNA-degrading endonuclease toxin of MazEF toxin-antitoxin module